MLLLVRYVFATSCISFEWRVSYTQSYDTASINRTKHTPPTHTCSNQTVIQSLVLKLIGRGVQIPVQCIDLYRYNLVVLFVAPSVHYCICSKIIEDVLMEIGEIYRCWCLCIL